MHITGWFDENHGCGGGHAVAWGWVERMIPRERFQEEKFKVPQRKLITTKTFAKREEVSL
jgi:hypothetical protein